MCCCQQKLLLLIHAVYLISRWICMCISIHGCRENMQMCRKITSHLTTSIIIRLLFIRHLSCIHLAWQISWNCPLKIPNGVTQKCNASHFSICLRIRATLQQQFSLSDLYSTFRTIYKHRSPREAVLCILFSWRLSALAMTARLDILHKICAENRRYFLFFCAANFLPQSRLVCSD